MRNINSLEAALAWIQEELREVREDFQATKDQECLESHRDYLGGVIDGLERADTYIQQQLNGAKLTDHETI